MFYSSLAPNKKSLIEDMHVTKIISFWQLEDRYCYVLEMESTTVLDGLIIEVDGNPGQLYPIRIIDPDTETNFE